MISDLKIDFDTFLREMLADGDAYADTYFDGRLSPELLQTSLTIAEGKHQADKFFGNKTLTVAELIGDLHHFERGPKDGRCILPGALANSPGQRIASNVTAQYLALFDDDSGCTVSETAEKIPPGLFALIWSTHSHNRTETLINDKTLREWLKKRGSNADPVAADCVTHLIETKKAKATIFESAEIQGKLHNKEGVHWRLQHKPWARCRVLLLLKRPFVVMDRPGGTVAAHAEWKHITTVLAEQLGIAADRACTDVARLMFTPRIAHGAKLAKDYDDDDERHRAHDICCIAGEALDWEAFLAAHPGKDAPAAKSKASTAKPKRETPDGKTASHEFATPHLLQVLKTANKSFRAADALRDLGANVLKEYGEANGKLEITCPG